MSITKKLLSSQLKSILRPFLLNELSSNQLSNLEGKLLLEHLELKPEIFNAYLPFPYRVVSGTLSLALDWENILSEIHISLKDVHVVIRKDVTKEELFTEENTNEKDDTPTKEELSANLENFLGSLQGAQSLLRTGQEKLEKALHVTISNLSLELEGSTLIQDHHVSLIIRVPCIEIQNFSFDKTSATMSLPENFSVAIHKSKPDEEEGVEILLVDGPDFIGCDLLTPTTLTAKIVNEKGRQETLLDFNLRSFRMALDPDSLKTIMTILEIGNINKREGNEMFADMTESVEEMKTEIIDLLGEEDYFSPDSECELIDSFFDCAEGEEEEDFFISILEPKAGSSSVPLPEKLFQIKCNVKQATCTVLHESNSGGVYEVFSKPFDISKLDVPPYTPNDHTTFYIADLKGCLEQRTNGKGNSTKCDFSIQTCGATQYIYHAKLHNYRDIEWWKSQYYTQIQLLNFPEPPVHLQNVHDPITCHLSIEKATTISIDVHTISMLVDDQIMGRFSAYLDLFQMNTSPDPDPSPDPFKSPSLSKDTHQQEKEEEEEKEEAHSFVFSTKVENLSLRVQSSTNRMYCILFDLEDVDISSRYIAHSKVQEWDITLNKITASLDRGNDLITILFTANRLLTNGVKILPQITIQCWERECKKEEECKKGGGSQVGERSIPMITTMDDYNRSTLNYAEEEETVPIPLIQPNKVFEGEKGLNPKIAPDETLDKFFFNASTEASLCVVVQLPRSSVDIAKENYDLLLSFAKEFASNFSNTSPTPPVPSPSPTPPKGTAPFSFVGKIIVGEGSIVLREKVSQSEGNEEDLLSSFHGTFNNYRAFFVSNYNQSESSYFYTCFDTLELKDCAPSLQKPIPLLQKPKYSVVHCHKMLTLVVEFNAITTVLLRLSDLSVQFTLGSDAFGRIGAFFIPSEGEGEGEGEEDVGKKEEEKVKENNALSLHCNLNNISVDYFPFSSAKKAACLFLIRNAVATVLPFGPKAEHMEIKLRCSPHIYLIDDRTQIVSIPESEVLQLKRNTYLSRIGFRKIGEITFCHILLSISLTPTLPTTTITLDRNKVEFRLCHDSFCELMELYNDYQWFSNGCISSPPNSSTSLPPGEYDDDTFKDPVEAPIAISIQTLEDYHPQPVEKETEEKEEEPKESEKLENIQENTFDEQVAEKEEQEANVIESKKEEIKASVIEREKEYVLVAVADLSDLPSNAVLVAETNPMHNPNGNVAMGLYDSDDEDDTFIGNQSLHTSSVQNPAHAQLIHFDATTLDEEIEGFEMVDGTTKEAVPIVRMSSHIIERMKQLKQENMELPPVLGATVIKNYVQQRGLENHMSCPDDFPLPSLHVKLENCGIIFSFHDGRHWSLDSKRENNQSETNKIELRLENVSVAMFTFSDYKIQSRIGISIETVEMFDKLEASDRNKMLCYDANYLRASDSAMVNILIEQHASLNNKASASRLKVRILPLFANIFKDAGIFLQTFFSTPHMEVPEVSSTMWDISISDIYMLFNYKAKFNRFKDISGIANFEVWNLLPSLSNAKFRFKGIEEDGVADTELGSLLVDKLISDQFKHIQSFAAGLGPLVPVVNVGTGLFNLFAKPISSYRNDGRVIRGIKEGVSDCTTSIVSEGLNVGSKLVYGTQVFFGVLDDVLNYTRPDVMKVDESDARASHPENLQEGFVKALESVSRESNVTMKYLFAIPMEEYQSKGVGASVNALVHAVPIAIIHPMIGITEGINQLGMGARNQISTKDVNTIYKS